MWNGIGKISQHRRSNISSSHKYVTGICKELLAVSDGSWAAGAAAKQELLLPSLLIAAEQQQQQQQQQQSSEEGERGMDVDAATGEGEEDGAEAEKGALAGKHHLCIFIRNCICMCICVCICV